MREAIAADLEHDPTFKDQRHIARYMIGALINQLRGQEPFGWGTRYRQQTNEEMADQAEALARKHGIIAPPDGLHHAPMCPANLWAGKMLPFAPCSCGAAADAARRNKAA